MKIPVQFFRFVAVLIVFASSFSVALAQGLIQCGGTNPDGSPQQFCRLCDFGSLVNNLMSYLIIVAIPLAAGLFAYAGFLYFISSLNPGKRAVAKKIFTTTALGFAVALSAWLIVNFIMSTLVTNDFRNWTNWSQFCGEYDPTKYNKSIPDWLRTLTNAAPTGGISQGQTGSAGGPLRVGTGECSPDNLTGTWGVNTNLMSCVAQNESSCGAQPYSTTDVTNDASRSPISVGLYQINLSANPISCVGVNLDCPKAFSGRYSASNRNVVIVNQDLYNQCVSAATDRACNTAAAQQIFNKQGATAWGTASRCSS